MAGNNLVKLLRCTSTTRANSTEILLNGQPLVEQDTHLIYVGDGVTEARNLTPYGGGGAQLEDNCVLYSEVQTLTDEQKEQARTNINAQTANLFFKNVQVPANSFVADTTYNDYPFRAAIALSPQKNGAVFAVDGIRLAGAPDGCRSAQRPAARA